MNRRFLTCSALLASALLTAGCDGEDEDDHHHDDEAEHGDDTTGGDTGEADLANGQAIHDGTCMIAGCHLDNGEQLEVHVPDHSDAELFQVIDQGTEDMPAQAQLSDQDIEDVIAYVRTIYP
jgi:mono/diheme cytochrome c family protein